MRLKCIIIYAISTAKPTYWPTDRQKIPDLIHFFLLKKYISELRNYLRRKRFELRSFSYPSYSKRQNNRNKYHQLKKIRYRKKNIDFIVEKRRIRKKLLLKDYLKNQQSFTTYYQSNKKKSTTTPLMHLSKDYQMKKKTFYSLWKATKNGQLHK